MTEPNLIPLGQLVLQSGLLTEAQLELALAEHLATGKRLGEIFVQHGWLTEPQLEAFLQRQRDGASGVDLLRASMSEAEAELGQPTPGAGPEDDAGSGHLLFVWGPAGYALLGRSGAAPPVGSEVGVSGGRQVVVKLGPSPLPGDRRRCAYLDAPS